MSRIEVYAYKGVLGIAGMADKPEDLEGVIVNPYTMPGNIGFLVKLNSIRFTKEAIEELRKIPKGNDGLGEIECFKPGDKEPVFGWLGGRMKAIQLSKIETSRDWNTSLLTDDLIDATLETSKGFMDMVDEALTSNQQ